VRDRLSERAFSGVVPVFPLPEVVFFPGAILPLHVFEPRYLALVGDARAGEGLIAVATLLPGWEDDSGGAPPFHPLATVGRIDEATDLEDGRMNVRLLGLERVRLDEEFTDRPYRRARARVEPDRAVDEADPEVVELKSRLLAGYAYLAQLVGGAHKARVIPIDAVPFESAVHTLCQTLDLPLRDKLMALEEEGPWERVPFARRALVESLDRALSSPGLPGVKLGASEGN
jgi:Lon protease-like protein